jgi:hypothetical protein
MASLVPSIAELKQTAVSNKTVLGGLAIVFVFAFSGMVINSYCADHIARSSCGGSDPHALDAKRWAKNASLLSAFVSFAAVAAGLYVLLLKKRFA